ncbi:hypothetical protein [Roseovarius aestuarii]|uniref:Uncharacterized protein n=1 Tax=Roseovarius aestuarii TaxID=475083 RepID=A0A1X7BNR1_9RHOB|nr:hypothetical protein [Roseovarius aestuarii]SMC10919.1 hypothetical protein ROA7745_00727 [Roseovarius aestuarii]
MEAARQLQTRTSAAAKAARPEATCVENSATLETTALQEQADNSPVVQRLQTMQQVANTLPSRNSEAIIQRVVSVGGVNQDNADTTWARISADPLVTAMNAADQTKAQKYLSDWVSASATSKNPLATSQNRQYNNDDGLIRALVGEVGSEANLATEGTLATSTKSSANITGHLTTFMTKLTTFHNAQGAPYKTAASAKKGRYNYYYSTLWESVWGGGKSLGQAMANQPTDLDGKITLVADYALKMRHNVRDVVGVWNVQMTAGQNAARKCGWNPNEAANWTQTARAGNVPLNAGPSATTAQILTLAATVGATGAENEALAWAIFAFFNKSLALNKSGTHRFHEVMDVAANYGVPYVPLAYPAAAP